MAARAPKRQSRNPVRRTIFDGISEDANLYCSLKDLTNEASVENLFVDRMLADLGYRDEQIKVKTAIDELVVSEKGGAKSSPYKPDYALLYRKTPRWVIDAKAPTEDLDKWVPQCSAYCLGLNQRIQSGNPVEYFMLTNGIETRVYRWDSINPLLALKFSDWNSANPNYERLTALLSEVTIVAKATALKTSTFRFERPTPQKAQALFAQCHRLIWKSEGQGPTGAFMEFTKLMFVKLWCDRQLRQDSATKTLLEKTGTVELPSDAVAFSLSWIDKQKYTASPVNDILFKRLRDEIEDEIAKKKKKRIFDPDEKIDMRPDTIRQVVERLQHWDMFGIDEDLNGRLFESFLNATMRGRELGQYFTPRSIVKLITRMADIKVGRTPAQVERVIDACCGTGGFLIEALTEMRNSVRANASLSQVERDALIERICNESLYGIDFGKSPRIARIARINMYLHGDGGSRVYDADALDKKMEIAKTEDAEIRNDQEELKRALAAGLKFQCAVTNPPFSMTKELRNEAEAKILRQYDLAKVPGTTNFRSSLRSNALFMERYRDLLEDGGRLLTVIDDSLLAGNAFRNVRTFLREQFIIRAIISLPGDAFQRSGARAKTSAVYLTKRAEGDTSQPDIFVYECRNVGLDDVVLRTPASVAERRKTLAAQEINEVVAAFKDYLSGKRGAWLVPSSRLSGRLDAKFLLPWSTSGLESAWQANGATSDAIKNLVDSVWDSVELQPDLPYSFLRINYSGKAEEGERRLGKEVGYSDVAVASEGDIVISNISAVYKAICVVPPEATKWLISKEFTILRPKPEAQIDPAYLWAVLRSAAVVAEWLSGATGVGRHRVDWDLLKDQKIPVLPFGSQTAIGDRFRKAARLERESRAMDAEALAGLWPLDLESQQARDRLASAKPPK